MLPKATCTDLRAHQRRKIPQVFEDCDKLARQKRSQFFKVQEMHLYYTGGMFLCQY